MSRLSSLDLSGDAPRKGVAGEVRGMARGGTLNLVAALCSQFAVLAITGLLAHAMGRTELGRYAQCYALLSLLSLLSLSGLRAGLTRFVVVHLVDADYGGVRGTVRLGLGLTFVSSSVIGAGLFLAAPWFAGVFHDSALVSGIRLVAFALPASALQEAALAATQGWRTMRPYAVVGSILEPLVRLTLTAVVVFVGGTYVEAVAVLTVSSWVGAIVALLWLLCYTARTYGPPVRYYPRELFGFSAISWAASVASNGLIWSSTILLGIFATSADVGVYNVATRLVALAVFVMPPINGAFSPRIAHLYHERRYADLRRTYSVATSWIVRLSLPAFVALIVFPGDLLKLFGHDFRVGATVTIVLAIGKLMDAATGPCALMLNMSGRPALNMLDNVGGLVVNVLLNIVLIPTLGIVGAALAWALTLWLVNGARLLQVRSTLNMLPFDGGVAKGVAAGAVALGAGLLAHSLLPGGVRLLGEVAVTGVAYVLGLLLLGPTPEDRIVFDSVLRRLPGRGRASRPAAA